WGSRALRFIGGWKNMASKRFHAGMALRIALILSTALLLSYVVTRTDWYVSMGLLVLAVMGETAMLIDFAARWSREVTRFLASVAFDDVSASFVSLSSDTVFGEL